ncbi:hypothetical protein FVE85_3905 [Porphyridium purpureum]|uniref:Uncharacterized protein n=1 Tax=Porphyridium purpureum TaxID=35688 RepID=A0A5J4YSN8_PORPP|nr:hypothetical protein FVE85_3905 [Porphyridium purpureum]|eukprot:POR8025..scf229_5
MRGVLQGVVRGVRPQVVDGVLHKWDGLVVQVVDGAPHHDCAEADGGVDGAPAPAQLTLTLAGTYSVTFQYPPENVRPLRWFQMEENRKAGMLVDRIGFNTALVRLVLAKTFLKHEADHVRSLVLQRMRMQIPIVSMEHVRVLGASSCARSAHSNPSHTLVSDDRLWWISATRSPQHPEYIEFALGQSANEEVQVALVSMRIPPLPYGPLSVRLFRIESWDARKSAFVFHTAHVFSTLDTGGWQTFLLDPPVESSRIRLVCLQNACQCEVSSFEDMVESDAQFSNLFSYDSLSETCSHSSIGLYQVRFC